MIDTIKRPLGFFYLDVYRHGVLFESIEEPNMVVKGYQTSLSRLIGGSDTALWAVAKIGFGTNTVAPSFNQTALTDSFVKAVDAATYPTTDKAAFTFTLDAGEANGKNISEFGLLTGNNTLFARKTRAAPLVKTADISLAGRWVIQFLP